MRRATIAALMMAAVPAVAVLTWMIDRARRASEGRHAAAVMTGTVRSIFGDPIAGAFVYAFPLGPGDGDSGRRSDAMAVTAADGTFTFRTGPSDHVVVAEHARFVVGNERAMSGRGASAPISIVLVPAASIEGRVWQATTNEPVQGAKVSARGGLTVGSASRPPVEVLSGPDGSFGLDGLLPGTIDITVSRGDLANGQPIAVPVLAGAHISGVEVKIEKVPSISGIVVSQLDALRTIASVWVTARDVETGETITSSQPTAGNGAFSVFGLHPGGRYALSVRGRDWAASYETAVSVVLKDADVMDLTVPVRVVEREPSGVAVAAGNGHIVGRVVATNGRPVAHARVMIASSILSPAGWQAWRHADRSFLEDFARPDARRYGFRYVDADSDGAFEVMHVAAGSYEFSVYDEGDRSAARTLVGDDPALPTVIRVPEAHESDVTLRVRPCTGAIFGLAVDVVGKPLANVLVSAACEQSPFAYEERGSAVSNSHGEFVLHDLCDGDYAVVGHALTMNGVAVRYGVRIDDTTGLGKHGSSMQLQLRHGDPNVQQVALRLNAPSTLSGMVKNDGRPVPNFAWSLAGVSVRRGRSASLDGGYRLSFLEPGTYEFLVDAPQGYAVKILELQGGAPTHADIGLSPWSSARGRLVDTRGNAMPGIPVTLFFAPGEGTDIMEHVWPESYRLLRVSTDESGEFAFERVPARKARLSFGRLAILDHVVEDAEPQHGGAEAISIRLRQGEDHDLGKITVSAGQAGPSAVPQ